MENNNVIIISNIILIKYILGLIIVTLSLSLCYALHLNMEGILVILGQDRQIARYSITIFPILIMFTTTLLNKQLICLQLNVLHVSIVVRSTEARWRGGAVARWRGGAVARWRGGAVARWRGGAVARWRGSAVARWRGGAVARWRGGAVARWLEHRSSNFV